MRGSSLAVEGVKSSLDIELLVVPSIGCSCIFISSNPGRGSSIAGGLSTTGCTGDHLCFFPCVGVALATTSCQNRLRS